ncbi:poly(A)-specific ribonuclease PARN-like isoform X1 [Zingiber officinale]|uniref:poly(A)-specific ribonuclease PARN-like isoform X1 n=1 Tax=Zingiber officinale TaxID=94328 RepID=UPI001C4BBE32|nr:poly(A)-specific ribonuclease PARN-like isoform X1 [Zingiber officinale]
MQVTRSNFNAALEGLRACVEESDFVVVDLEMTGVTSAPWRNSFEFDRSDVRYLKLKDSVEKFAVVQFGVCPFRWDSSKGSFFAHPHNFYIFPRNELPLHGPPDDFLWQVTSIDFLAKCQFDFNACIYEVSCRIPRANAALATTTKSKCWIQNHLLIFCLIFSTKLVGSLICTREAIYLMKFEDKEGKKKKLKACMLLARGWRNKLLKGKKTCYYIK